MPATWMIRKVKHKKINLGQPIYSMSQHFKLLNCISSKRAKGREIHRWMMNCTLQGIAQEAASGVTKGCIIDTGCNITTISYGLVKHFGLKMIPTTNILVTIADGSTYSPLGLIDINVIVANTTTAIRALVSSGDKVLLGFDWMEKVSCVLDIPSRQLTLT